MDRTERLLDLVALLLDASDPIPWIELRDAFPEDYGRGTTTDAAERKFERDKAELLELGIPITYVQGDDERRDGYIVDREAYYLPDLKLTPEEVAVLYAAGSAALASGAFPGAQDLSHALRKVGFLAGQPVTTPKVRVELGALAAGPDLASKLEALWAATSARKFVQIDYWSPRSGNQSRRVDPYGLALRRGLWSLVGYCHLRQGVRTFLVHRIRSLTVNPSKPRSTDFEVPKDFSLDRYVASHAWQHNFHDPVPVTVELSGDLAPLAERLLPGSVVERHEGIARATVTATFIDGLSRYVLALAPRAKIVSPAPAVERFREMATRAVQRHGSGEVQS